MNDTTANHDPITPIAARSYTVNIRGPRSSPAMRLRLTSLGKIRTEQLCDRSAQARRGEPTAHGTREALDGLIDLLNLCAAQGTTLGRLNAESLSVTLCQSVEDTEAALDLALERGMIHPLLWPRR